MIIYRIEHKIYGMGPYSTRNLPRENKKKLAELYDKHGACFAYNAYHPRPINVKRGYYFGFESIDDLKKWFNRAGMLIRYHKLGYVCRIYQVDEKYIENLYCQLSFNKTYAKCLDEMMLDKLDI